MLNRLLTIVSIVFLYCMCAVIAFPEGVAAGAPYRITVQLYRADGKELNIRRLVPDLSHRDYISIIFCFKQAGKIFRCQIDQSDHFQEHTMQIHGLRKNTRFTMEVCDVQSKLYHKYQYETEEFRDKHYGCKGYRIYINFKGDGKFTYKSAKAAEKRAIENSRVRNLNYIRGLDNLGNTVEKD